MDGPLPLAVLTLTILALLVIDLKVFARNREPTFREGVYWSIGWFVLALLAAIPLALLSSTQDAVTYTTVYLIERSLSLDNLFVFLMLFAYFAVPHSQRSRLLFAGIVLALMMRGLAIVAGVALIEQFHFVIYILGATLLILAIRLLKGVDEDIDPNSTLVVRAVRRVLPVTDGPRGSRWIVREDGLLHSTPLLLCLVAIVFSDIAFAIDSIPAAFAITQDSFLIWMGNAFALLGMRALFTLVADLRDRFRYLDETIAIVLMFVAVKLLIEDIYKIGIAVSLGVVLGLLIGGMVVSRVADRRDKAGGQGD